MTADFLRNTVHRRPFRPFIIHVAGGRSIPVHARDFILVSPLGPTVDVYQPDETHDILVSGAITGISFFPITAPPPGEAQQSSN